MSNRAFYIPLFFLMLSSLHAWDGCKKIREWRCGDICIDHSRDCKCGGKIFSKKAQMWCCQTAPCTKVSSQSEQLRQSLGKKKIGAICTGAALSLSQPCNQTCNFYKGISFIGSGLSILVLPVGGGGGWRFQNTCRDGLGTFFHVHTGILRVSELLRYISIGEAQSSNVNLLFSRKC